MLSPLYKNVNTNNIFFENLDNMHISSLCLLTFTAKIGIMMCILIRLILIGTGKISYAEN